VSWLSVLLVTREPEKTFLCAGRGDEARLLKDEVYQKIAGGAWPIMPCGSLRSASCMRPLGGLLGNW